MNARIGILVAIIMVFLVNAGFGQIPSGYYDPADGLSGEALKAALHDIIDDHTELSYNNTTNALRVTDEDPNNSNNL